MSHKLFSLFISIMMLFLSKISFSSELSNLEKLPTKGPFSIICRYLDIESFKNFNLISKAIRKKILDLNKITEERTEEEVEKLCQKFQQFLNANRDDLPIYTHPNTREGYTSLVQSYFRIFTFDKMKESGISQQDLEIYHSLQQAKHLGKYPLLIFMQKNLYQKINDKIYNCFLEDFNKRFKNYNILMIDYIDLAGKRISFLSPCISRCISLTHLFLHKNNLKFLPHEIGLCKKIEYIHLGENNLESLPPEIVGWTFINNIILYNNNIRNFEKIRNLFKEKKVEFFFDWAPNNSFPSEDNAEEEN